MPSKQQLRKIVRDNQDEIVRRINAALQGKDLAVVERVLTRIGRGGVLPHWYANLKSNGTLPNLDGKTIGSVVEMLLVGVLESSTLKGKKVGPLRVNPARGVDLPDLDLGVKSPSKNYCTSEPFFSAYERLLGNECDILVLISDYQIKKQNPPLRLQITDWQYLTKTQVADSKLCSLAREHRDWLIADNESAAQRVFQFLAYVNQSDWRAKRILRAIKALKSEAAVKSLIENARADFNKKNVKATQESKPLIPDSDLEAIERIGTVSPCHVGIIEAATNWVADHLKDAARLPSTVEWNALKTGPLDGRIGMSFALQWRYNFKSLFETKSPRRASAKTTARAPRSRRKP